MTLNEVLQKHTKETQFTKVILTVSKTCNHPNKPMFDYSFDKIIQTDTDVELHLTTTCWDCFFKR